MKVTDGMTCTPAVQPVADNPQSSIWFEALMSDADTIVLAVGREGRISLANDVAVRFLCGGREKVVGRRFHDFFSQEFADERVGLIHRVLETGRSLAVIGMVGGSWRRAIIRPIPSPGGDPNLALIVCSLATAMSHKEAIDGHDVVTARVNDMGHLAALSKREIEVLTLLGQGLSTAETAKALHRTTKTIEWHRAAIGRKLGLTNRAGLARIAIESGLIARSKSGCSTG